MITIFWIQKPNRIESNNDLLTYLKKIQYYIPAVNINDVSKGGNRIELFFDFSGLEFRYIDTLDMYKSKRVK